MFAPIREKTLKFLCALGRENYWSFCLSHMRETTLEISVCPDSRKHSTNMCGPAREKISKFMFALVENKTLKFLFVSIRKEHGSFCLSHLWEKTPEVYVCPWSRKILKFMLTLVPGPLGSDRALGPGPPGPLHPFCRAAETPRSRPWAEGQNCNTLGPRAEVQNWPGASVSHVTSGLHLWLHFRLHFWLHFGW